MEHCFCNSVGGKKKKVLWKQNGLSPDYTNKSYRHGPDCLQLVQGLISGLDHPVPQPMAQTCHAWAHRPVLSYIVGWPVSRHVFCFCWQFPGLTCYLALTGSCWQKLPWPGPVQVLWGEVCQVIACPVVTLFCQPSPPHGHPNSCCFLMLPL